VGTICGSRSWWAAIIVAALSTQQTPHAREPEQPTDPQALIAAGLYDRAEAVARSNVDRLRSSQGEASAELTAASDLLVRALIMNGRATSDETRSIARRTLEVKESRASTQPRDLVPSLVNLGDVLVAIADFGRAIPVLDRALSLSQGASGSGSGESAVALDQLGAALSEARRPDRALEVLRRSLQIKERLLQPNDVGIARTLEEIALALQRKGDYRPAAALLQRAAAIQEVANPAHPAYVRTLNLLAQQLWFEGRLIESKEASERAVALAEKTLRSDHPTLTLSLRYLSSTLADLGELDRALSLRERALALARQNLGAHNPAIADYLHALGLTELDRGSYAAARGHIQEALDIYERKYGPRHDYVATALSVLAEVDANLGDYSSAKREQTRAVEIHEHVSGVAHPYVARSLTDLAGIYREQGQAAQAVALLERALTIRRHALGDSHRDVALTLADLANVLVQIGRPVRAQALASEALDILSRSDTTDAPDYAEVLALYAEIQAARGNYAAARDYYERALEIRSRIFGPAHPAYAEVESGLSLTLANLRDNAAALRSAISAEAAGRDHLGLMLRSLPERQALSYAAARPRGLNVILSLTGALPDALYSGLDGLIRSRALVLDEIAARHGAGRTSDGEIAPLWAALTSAQQRLANLMVRGPGPMSLAEYRSVVADARRDSERAEQALAEHSAEFRAERRRANTTLSDVQAAIPARGALVSFAKYQRVIVGTRSIQSAGSRPRPAVLSYLAFVLRPSGPPVAVPLGSAAAIEPLVAEWRQAIAAAGNRNTPIVRSSRETGAALRRLIWDPIAGLLTDNDWVFVVPDGALNLVPFQALPTGRREYLVETGPTLHYLSAERDLVPAPGAANVGHGLLALGAPSFDDVSTFASLAKSADPARERLLSGRLQSGTQPGARVALRGLIAECPALQSVHFDPLPASGREAQDVAQLWREFGPVGTGDSSASRVLTGSAAGEQAFKSLGEGRQVLHLATHGFFLGDQCAVASSGTRSIGGLITAPKRPSALAPRAVRPVATENPLLMSGLAFAGVNHRAAAAPDEDDGILTAEEVASLNLEGVEWAVLSACDTGLGEIKAGEGVFGLRRAFQIAGAHTVIMSLWSVDDRAAMTWMRALYEARLRDGVNTAAAVRRASLAVLRERRARGASTEPFFWAGFVASGDWR
jgi:CHAT domain-containing protein/tetratricopeptide (TPR) repeat protein